MRKIIIGLSLLLFAGCGTSTSEEGTIQLEITQNVINGNYIGNGVQWDPYPEAEEWGAPVSEEDWEKLYHRLDYMKPQYVRCLINSPFRYYNAETGEYEKERNIESLKKVLQYCQDNDITVLFGEFNPPTWEMKDDPEWIEMAANYLNYLVNDLGFDCIEYYNLFNEPDGDWASTNGDFELWKKMIYAFHDEMQKYPGLADKVEIAGPDVVVDYKNPSSEYAAYEWVDQTAVQMDDVIGIYDIHAYPGQHQVRSGEFKEIIQRYRKNVPDDKQIIFGEAGYKYWREEDSLLMEEYNRRADEHPYTKGSDSNMMVYDFFYGLDMSMLAMDVMNGGYSALAAWMLDDAMHSDGDAGNKYDIKLWGMWNILGEEVFDRPGEEEIRPWYYTWSLMCRYFPQGTNVLEVKGDYPQEVRVVAGENNGDYTFGIVNVSDKDVEFHIQQFPFEGQEVKKYIFSEDNRPKDHNGFPEASKTGLELTDNRKMKVEKQSFMLLTTFEF